jgi:uncharacterized protein YabE (DUF348 family)
VNKITPNKFKEIIVNKHFFAALCVLLFLATCFLFKNEIFVKGESSHELPNVVWVDYEKIIVESNSADPAQILKDGGITLFSEDKMSTGIILDPVVDGGVGQKIVIKRAPTYFVEVDGKNIEVRSWEQNVGKIIEKSGVSLGAKDQISPKKESSLSSGATIVITRINEADVDVIEDVAFETIQKADASIPFGTKKVTQAGANGKIKKTYRIRYKNGIEVNRYLLTRETITPVVNKVVSSGSITGQSNYGDIYSGMTTSFYKRGYGGRYLLVTNNSNGKSVRVKIVDFGPTNGPILDLGIEAFRAIGGSTFHGHIDSVTVQLVD